MRHIYGLLVKLAIGALLFGILLMIGQVNFGPGLGLTIGGFVLAITFFILQTGAKKKEAEKTMKEMGLSETKISEFLNGVESGTPIIGMPEKILYITIGGPKKTNTSNIGGSVHKQLVYGKEINEMKYFYIEDGVLTSWQLPE